MRSRSYTKARVIKLSVLTRLLVPTLFLRSISKESIAMSFLRHRLMIPIAFIAIVFWLVISAMFDPVVGALSYVIFFWLIGTTGVVIIFNNTTGGLVFIRPRCYSCRFRDMIMRHEMLHLQGIVKEAEAWKILRNDLKSGALKFDPPSQICSYCPIPKHLSELN